eukprot:scaffold39105_cov76-Phaeocystis_antarctica.AAC.6
MPLSELATTSRLARLAVYEAAVIRRSHPKPSIKILPPVVPGSYVGPPLTALKEDLYIVVANLLSTPDESSKSSPSRSRSAKASPKTTQKANKTAQSSPENGEKTDAMCFPNVGSLTFCCTIRYSELVPSVGSHLAKFALLPNTCISPMQMSQRLSEVPSAHATLASSGSAPCAVSRGSRTSLARA